MSPVDGTNRLVCSCRPPWTPECFKTHHKNMNKYPQGNMWNTSMNHWNSFGHCWNPSGILWTTKWIPFHKPCDLLKEVWGSSWDLLPDCPLETNPDGSVMCITCVISALWREQSTFTNTVLKCWTWVKLHAYWVFVTNTQINYFYQ